MTTASPKTWTRRAFLAAGGAGALAALPALRATTRWLGGADGIFLSASDDLDGRHFISATDVRGRKLFSLEVEQRCHGCVVDPRRPERAVVIARRSGTIAYDVDLAAGAIRGVVRSGPERHFFGHAVFAPDGSVLYTTENDRSRDAGLVAVRDASDLRVLAELPTHGVGPHELLLLPDGRTLVVANGGIVTDVVDGRGQRRDVNLAAMDPSLVYLDVRDGRRLAQLRPDDHQASIRHLALGSDGTVGVALQYAGPEANPYPVAAFHRGEERLRLVQAPRESRVRMRRYAASVAIAPGGVAAVTCPRGDVVALFDVASGALVREVEIRDAGGVAVTRDGGAFVVSTGLGELHRIDAATLRPLAPPRRADRTRWDNHLTPVVPS
ncbi:MAG: DUF1513 domain-containing protein [Thermodesulfobacteriota bacterium]